MTRDKMQDSTMKSPSSECATSRMLTTRMGVWRMYSQRYEAVPDQDGEKDGEQDEPIEWSVTR